MVTAMWGDHARNVLGGTRFADVRWVESTGSTNADLLAAAAEGEADGVVLVAEEQTAGRGRLDRTWDAPSGSSLLCSVLVRPDLPVGLLQLLSMASRGGGIRCVRRGGRRASVAQVAERPAARGGER
jgi:BirA family transcriptional regulator, biotin operon repressor / biotin---[acetyl-CoA-carboxylase] ligase